MQKAVMLGTARIVKSSLVICCPTVQENLVKTGGFFYSDGDTFLRFANAIENSNKLMMWK